MRIINPESHGGNATIFQDRTRPFDDYVDFALQQKAQEDALAAKNKGPKYEIPEMAGGAHPDDLPLLQKQFNNLLSVGSQLSRSGRDLNDLSDPLVAQYRQQEQLFMENERQSKSFAEQLAKRQSAYEVGLRSGKVKPGYIDQVVPGFLEQRKGLESLRERFGMQAPEFEFMPDPEDVFDPFKQAKLSGFKGVAHTSGWETPEAGGQTIGANKKQNAALAEQLVNSDPRFAEHFGSVEESKRVMTDHFNSQIDTKRTSKRKAAKGTIGSDTRNTYGMSEDAKAIPVGRFKSEDGAVEKLMSSGSLRSISVQSKSGSPKKMTMQIGTGASTNTPTYVDGEPIGLNEIQNMNNVTVSSIELMPVGHDGKILQQAGDGTDMAEALKNKEYGDNLAGFVYMVNARHEGEKDEITGEKSEKKILVPFEVVKSQFPGLKDIEPVQGIPSDFKKSTPSKKGAKNNKGEIDLGF